MGCCGRVPAPRRLCCCSLTACTGLFFCFFRLLDESFNKPQVHFYNWRGVSRRGSESDFLMHDVGLAAMSAGHGYFKYSLLRDPRKRVDVLVLQTKGGPKAHPAP